MFSHRFKQCSISFLVKPGRSRGIKLCPSAPGINSKVGDVGIVVYPFWFSFVGVVALKRACALLGYTTKTRIIMLII